MKFVAGEHYFSDTNNKLTVLKRKERFSTTGQFCLRIYAFTGFGNPAYYRIQKDHWGREFVVIKGRTYEAR